jgi:hypothetical protein
MTSPHRQRATIQLDRLGTIPLHPVNIGQIVQHPSRLETLRAGGGRHQLSRGAEQYQRLVPATSVRHGNPLDEMMIGLIA